MENKNYEMDVEPGENGSGELTIGIDLIETTICEVNSQLDAREEKASTCEEGSKPDVTEPSHSIVTCEEGSKPDVMEPSYSTVTCEEGSKPDATEPSHSIVTCEEGSKPDVMEPSYSTVTCEEGSKPFHSDM
jgi:hypothetical protein